MLSVLKEGGFCNLLIGVGNMNNSYFLQHKVFSIPRVGQILRSFQIISHANSVHTTSHQPLHLNHHH